MYYRGVALHLFRGERITYRLAIRLSLVFSLSHAVNFFFADPLSVALQLLLAFALGVFTLGAFLRTRNIIIPILAHFLLNGTAMLFGLFSRDSRLVSDTGYFILAGMLTAALTAVGMRLVNGVLDQEV